MRLLLSSSLATGFFCLALVRARCSELCAAPSTPLERISVTLGKKPSCHWSCNSVCSMQTPSFSSSSNTSLDLLCPCSQKSCLLFSQLFGECMPNQPAISPDYSSASPCFPYKLWQTKAKSRTSWVRRASPLAPGHLCLVSASPSVSEGQTVRHCIFSPVFSPAIFLLPAINEGSVSLIVLLYSFACQVLRRLQMHPCTTLVLF